MLSLISLLDSSVLLNSMQRLACEQCLARSTVTERSSLAQLAAANVHGLRGLIKTELERLKGTALVG